MALAIFLLFAIRAGLPSSHASRAIFAVVLTQILPGVLIWRIVRPSHGWWAEDIVTGFALGACLAVAVQTVAGTFGIPWLAGVSGPALALALLIFSPTRSKIQLSQTEQLPRTWGPAVAAISLLLLVPTQGFYRRIPLDWTTGFRSFYPDMPFHLSLASQLAHRGPSEVPFVLGEPLNYHWFSHAWVAQTSLAADVPLDAVLYRVMPPLMAVFVVWGVAAVAVRISKRFYVGPLAAIVAVGAGELDLLQGARPGSLVNPLSPSLGYSTLVILALLALLAIRWNEERSAVSAILLGLLAFTLPGAKGSALPVVGAGVGLATLWSWLARMPERKIITKDAILLFGGALSAYVILFRGRTGGLRLDPIDSLMTTGVARSLLENADIGILVLILAAGVRMISVLARGAGLLATLNVPHLRRDPTIPLVLGMGLAGAGAVVALTHPGQSQWYILRNAAPAMAIGSAIGFTALWESLGKQRAQIVGIGGLVGLSLLVIQAYAFPELSPETGVEGAVVWRLAALAAVIVAGALFAALVVRDSRTSMGNAVITVLSASLVLAATVPAVLEQVERPMPPYSQAVEPNAQLAFSRDQITAARWLRDHSDSDDVVATNRHCGAPDWQNCDSRRFFVAAYTERRVLVEGWAYTRSWSEAPEVELGKAFKPFWDSDKLRLNDSFLETPSGAEARALYEEGVRWLYVDKTAPYSEELHDYARPRYETEWAKVFELDSDSPMAKSAHMSHSDWILGGHPGTSQDLMAYLNHPG